ncbi:MULTISPECIES: response regulator [unclassified Colwellia]|jgi:two-component system chemotaxis response regulator CheY|uniref:response regulator n=1 Tax=unclassified Colwellia TaxID=196834 RepID=UPI0015F59A08|nr:MULTISPECIES: response regulator [unclassified Colwellia]MBA6223885.1 response regulator [Colwellia sp. MB3u-45]MBA6267408.1 response regulator [Colwellia sp. MB3u-43]MBA6289350.1 response regulator [Colwellia sp. MB3u-4]MBA6320066.1 response regulator [Colwellia sp. MB02u-19]MBA6324864.1 response regulator [Colwellia sp. MB02u-18]
MKILVVDDNPLILNSLSDLLFAQGYCVNTGCHGLDASEKLQNEYYDLVIVDHLMPIMNGIQLTKHIRQHKTYLDTPVILMTTQGHQSLKLICNTNLFSAVIDKPIDVQNLLKLIKSLLSVNTRYQLL